MNPTLATKEYRENGYRCRIDVEGGLRYCKGNKAPHFSLTCSYGSLGEHAKGIAAGGCAHDEIRKHFGDRFSDLAALHLSDIDGTPMYALENGFFVFHDDGGYKGSRPTWEQRRERAARHFRISEDDVESVLLPMLGEGYSKTAGVFMQGMGKAKQRIAEWVGTQKPRWKAEANACIAKHGLVVYGDPWVAK